MADNLTIFMCQLSRNLGVSTYWNPQILPRPVQIALLLPYYVVTNSTKKKCSEIKKTRYMPNIQLEMPNMH